MSPLTEQPSTLPETPTSTNPLPEAPTRSGLEGSQLVIRPATSDDIPTLVVLRRSMLAAMHTPDEFESGWEDAFAAWLERRIVASDYQMIVAELDGRIVAGAQAEVIHGQPGPKISRDRIYITNVSTLPEFRGRGLASRCLDALLDWARDKGIRTAMLNATSMGQRIYQRAGFILADNPEYRLQL